MYNFNDTVNLVSNSMAYEGLTYDGILLFLLDMGVSISMADDIITEIDIEMALAA